MRLDFAPPAPAPREHLGVHVHHDLVPVRRKGRCVARLEHPVGHPRERIGPAHGDRRLRDRRPTWDVRRGGVFLPPVRGRLLGRVGGHRRLQGAHDPCGHLRREPSVQDHRAVVLVPEGEPALSMPGIGAFGLVRLARLAIEAGEFLHVRRSAVPADVEQVRLVVGGRDAGERAHLGVAKFALWPALRTAAAGLRVRARPGPSRGRYGRRCRTPNSSQWAHDHRPLGRPTACAGRARR